MDFNLSVVELGARYREGSLTASEVTKAYLERLEPGPVYRVVTEARALRQAERADALFRQGVDVGPLQGVPLALKDLMDTKGEVSAAGSPVLAGGPPAAEDCPAAARLDAAGAVFLGKTNMTELAFSGLGINPHYGTPPCALSPSRVPGGSSSGSAVAVALGLAAAAIGSDTGGSVRIPAAFNGLVGLKTTGGRIPTDGCVPLSTTLDTLGPITRTVEDAWHLWRALCAAPHRPFERGSVEGLKLLAPTTVLGEELEPPVASAFERACDLFRSLGAEVDMQPAPILSDIPEAYARYGSFASMESLAIYEEMLEREGLRVDPRVSRRILKAREARATDYIRLGYERQRIQREFWATHGTYDAILAPTVAILPPATEALSEDDAYFRANSLVLRNTMIFNFLGTPAVSVPCGAAPEGLSVGLMIAARPDCEALVLQIAAALEEVRG